jgi:hypothetical protein
MSNHNIISYHIILYMGKNHLNKKSQKLLKYISDDILNNTNPIKYLIKNFIKYWNINEQKINQLFYILINKLSVNEVVVKNPSKEIRWKPIKHQYPFIYNEYINKSNNIITYEEFKESYHKREIMIDNFNFKQYFDKYIYNNTHEYNEIYKPYYNLEIGQFSSLDIKLYVENNINSLDIYNWNFLDLYFFSSNIDNSTKKHIIQLIYQISKWLYDINPLYKITLYYFDTPLEKKISDSVDIKYLSSNNVNSGVSSSNKFIMIWRREEISKVLIHELIHYLEIDMKYNDKLDLIIKHKLGTLDYHPVIVNECLTEILAQFFHSIYMSYSISNHQITKDIFKIFKTIYQYELIFSWYQFAQIMNYYMIDKYTIQHLMTKFHQSSNVYSYYILKCILTIDSSIIFIIINKLIPELGPDKEIISYITRVLDEINIPLINKVIQNLNFNDRSLRMSLFGYY